jgi:hypothetical protein
MSLAGQHVWPSNVKKLNWPPDGVTYSYEYHKYIKPEKLARWLETFGPAKGKYVVGNQFLGSHTNHLMATHCVARGAPQLLYQSAALFRGVPSKPLPSQDLLASP